MKRIKSLIGIYILTALAANQALAASPPEGIENADLPAETFQVVGSAFSLGDGQLLYREYHYYSKDLLDHRVIYRSPDDEPVADKTLDYRSGFTTPSFVQQDELYPQLIDVKLQEDRLSIKYVQKGDSPEKKTLKAKVPLVIDAGFDYFVRENWQSLIDTGKSMDFYYPAPTRLSLMELRMQHQPCSEEIRPGEEVSAECFTITSANWLIRVLIDPIEIAYDPQTQQLLRFRGLGNVFDSGGSGMKVDIQYCYPQPGDTGIGC